MSSSESVPTRNPVIAIDGPAGSGKSTVARGVASALGYDYLDTGAMYRAITLIGLKRGVDIKDAAALSRLADEAKLTFRTAPGGERRLSLNGIDVSEDIRMPDVTAAVSAVSSHAGVRDALVKHQRELAAAAGRGAVVEGRDVGTVVFPQATLKVYLDASVEERAHRRQKDMAAAGVIVDLDELVKLLITRDKMDSTRELSPLAKAGDAVTVDTTKMTIEEAVGLIVRMAQEREGKI